FPNNEDTKLNNRLPSTAAISRNPSIPRGYFGAQIELQWGLQSFTGWLIFILFPTPFSRSLLLRHAGSDSKL
ncbi:hypothetical protein AVEN_150211-1, partial [Araneus ventricosus]